MQITCKTLLKSFCFIFLFIVVLLNLLLTLYITSKNNFIIIRQYIGWILQYCRFGPKKLAILVNSYNDEKSRLVPNICKFCLQQSCFLYKLFKRTAVVKTGYQTNGVVSVTAEDSERTALETFLQSS